jgi:hypothetical protein
MNVVTIISTAKDSLNRIIPKFLRLGLNDVQTSKQLAPFGVDSNPIKDMAALYAKAGEKGETFIVGYVNVQSLANVGEVRLFSTNNNGVVQVDIKVRNNGNIELGGNANNLVKYTPLNTGLNNQLNGINTELVKIQAAIAALGGAYAYAPVTLNISSSQVNNLKCQ